MVKDKKFYKNFSIMCISFIEDAYRSIFKFNQDRTDITKRFKLKGFKDFKKAQNLLLELVMGIERTLVLNKDFVKSIDATRFLLHYRSLASRLADCFVWITIGDAHVIKELSRGINSGYIFGKSGMESELKALDLLNSSSDNFAVLNDLTSCLHVGDILVNDLKDLSWRLLEVKSEGFTKILRNKSIDELSLSRKKEIDRFGKQILKHNLSMMYLKNGIGTDTKNRLKKTISSNVEEKYCTSEIENVLTEAMVKGTCVKEIEEGLVYGAYRVGLVKSGYQFLIDKMPKKYKFDSNTSLKPMPYLAINLQAPHLQPFFLLPINPELIFNLAFSMSQMYVYIDISVLIILLQGRGLDVCLTRKGLGGDVNELFMHNNQFLRISRKNESILLGQHQLARVFGEGLSLKSMVEIVTSYFNR